VIAAFLPEWGFWGVDALAYTPWMIYPFVAGVLLLLFPPVHTRIGRALSSICQHSWHVAVIPLIAGALIWILPVSLHYLGDGELLLRTFRLAVDSRPWQGINAPLPYHLIDHFRMSFPAESVIRILSGLSGVLYTVIVITLGRRLFSEAADRAVLFCLLLTPAYIQLFFGYIETYALIYPVLLAYLLTGCLSLRDRCPLAVPSFLMGILIVTHFSLVVLAPSLLVLATTRWRTRMQSRLRIVIDLLISPIVSFAVLRIVGFDYSVYTEGMKTNHLLPISSTPGFAYGLFSLTHLGNVVNELLLVASTALLLLAVYPRKWLSAQPAHLYLWSAVIPALVFTFLANPEIGAFRDWDAFAFPALPFLLLGVFALQAVDEKGRLRAAVVAGGATAVHTAFWLLTNAQPSSAEARYTTLLDVSVLTPTARSYGWEAVGSVKRRQNDLEGERLAFEKAAEANPTNYRYWNTLGTVESRRSRFAEAIVYYLRALEQNPESVEAHTNVGSAYYRTKQYDLAIDHYLQAVERQPDLVGELYANLGASFLITGRTKEALGAYEQAVSRKPTLIQAYFPAGNAANRLGDRTKAHRYYSEVLRRDPGFQHADLIRKWIAEIEKSTLQGSQKRIE
tara:strand:+ start:30726 stop:32591 length:1866 start_codon:yes stop_codon:yes gene_type:complete